MFLLFSTSIREPFYMSRRCDITVPEVENPLFNFEILCYVPVHLELYGM
jgi:hypothetical protein